jgi:subfamily B ATP-binding cassette protein HlyB/CyaB
MGSNTTTERVEQAARPWLPEHFTWLLGSLCRLQRRPWDAALLQQQFPPPHDRRRFLEAAAGLGLETSSIDTRTEALERLAFPLVALERAASAEAEGTEVPALLVKAESGRLLLFAAGRGESETIAFSDFAARFEPQVIAVAGPAAAVADEEGGAAPRRFGFRWFVPELLRHRRLWRDVLLASLVLQLTALATPLFTQVIIDKVIVHQTRSTLAAVAAGLALFLVVNAGLGWLRQYLILHAGNRIDAVLGASVFRHLLRLQLRYFEQRPSGTLIARLQGIETVRQFISGAAVSLLLDLPCLVVFLAVMFWYSVPLSLIAVATVAALALLSAGVTPLLRERVNEQFLKGARNQAFLTEYVTAMETVKTLQLEPQLERRYEGLLADYLAAGFRARQLSNTTGTLAHAIEQAQALAVLCVGALIVMRNDGFTIGMLVAFQMFAARMAQPMLRLAGLWQEFQQADIAVRRLGDLMDAPAEPQTLLPVRAPGAAAGAIRVRGLGFRHGEDRPWLYRHLDLDIAAGQLAVLSGPSGSGKSTLAKLLLGFYPPGEGRIELDGRDIRQFAANELRQYYGVVPQETVLFSGSVYDNLALASPQAGFDDIVRACRLAGIHEVIERLPQGYQTLLGEHGVGLSGGQRQRLAIARALLKRPRVLIFDEATSSLDPATAAQLALTVNQLKGKASILFIAHHLPGGLEPDVVFKLPGAQP